MPLIRYVYIWYNVIFDGHKYSGVFVLALGKNSEKGSTHYICIEL